MTENKLMCPQCGASVSKEDIFCKTCGATFSRAPPSPPLYTRRFGLVQRLYGALRSPSETRRDIGLAPDYGGVAIVLILKIALMVASFSIVMSKIHITGTYATEVTRMLSSVIALAVIIGFFLILLRWVVKSAIVWKACDEGSVRAWNFSNAASVTGYAYIAEVVLGIISVAVILFFIPDFYLDIDNLEIARQAAQVYQSQAMVLSLFQLPITFLSLIWKSYLGGIGTHYGTEERCSKTIGIAVFFILGLIGVMLSFFRVFA